MSDDSSTGAFSLFDRIAEDFVARHRRRERPSLQEYVDRHPEIASEIRELLPLLIEVELAGGQGETQAETLPGAAESKASPLTRVGEYRILREIGRGGMGVVYEAEQISLGRRVALKILSRAQTRDAVALERFRREARSAGRLHHTNIVPVFDVGQDGDVLFYAMQLIPGQGLDLVIAELRRLRDESRRVERETRLLASVPTEAITAATPPAGEVARSLLLGRLTDTTLNAPPTEAYATPVDTTSLARLPGGTPLSTNESSRGGQPFYRSVAEIGRQAAGALAHAHGQGIVHRDVKPSNLLLDAAGTVWVADFGLAISGDDGLTATGDILGTLRYMAPERYRGEGDARADVYALGITLYELLTLRPAFDSHDRLRLAQQIKDEEPKRPRSIDPRIPRDLETIVLKAIEKDPKRRYASAATLGDDLRRFRDGEPISARRVGEFEKVWKWAKRRPAVAGLIGLVAASMLIGTAASMWFAFRASERAEAARRAEALSRHAETLSRQSEAAAEVARSRAVTERDANGRLSAGLAVDRGITLAEQGRPEVGIHWMVEGLRASPDAGGNFGRMVRRNLAAWLEQIHKPLWIIPGLGGNGNRLLGVFSPDGRTFVTGHIDLSGNAAPTTAWDLATGRPLVQFPNATLPAAFRPDGKVLVTRQPGDKLAAYDSATGQALWTSKPPKPVVRLGFRPGGRELVVVTRTDKWNTHSKPIDEAYLWDADTGREVTTAGPVVQGEMYLVKDGNLLVIERAVDGREVLYRIDPTIQAPVEPFRSTGSETDRFGLSPNDRLLWLKPREGSDDAGLRVWDWRTHRPVGPPIAGAVNLNFFPAGDRALTQDSGGIFRYRDIASGRPQGSTLRGDGFDVGFQTSPDGRHALITSNYGTTWLWRLSADPTAAVGPAASGEVTPAAPARTRSVWATAPYPRLARDGRLAVRRGRGLAGRAFAQVVNPVNGRTVGPPALHQHSMIRSLTLDGAGQRFATGSDSGDLMGEVRLWDTATGQPIGTPLLHTNFVSALAFHPGGRLLAAGDYHGLVRLWDIASGREVVKPMVQESIVWSLAFSPDGRTLAVGHHFEQAGKPGVRLWDVATGTPRGELLRYPTAISELNYSPDGRMIVAGDGNSLQLWESATGRPLGSRLVGESAACFGPKGRAFVTAGTDGSIRLRDAATGNLTGAIHSGQTPVVCLAYRDDGELVVAGFGDGTVRLIDPATAKPIGPPRSLRYPITDVAFTTDGQRFVAIDRAGESRSWLVPGEMETNNLDQLTAILEARTGQRMAVGPTVVPLDVREWIERLDRDRTTATSPVPADDPTWHEPLARAAEDAGNTFAALWHLDRLVAARPNDWTTLARRAEVRATAIDFVGAADDYAQAASLAPSGAIFDEETQHAVAAATAGRLEEALWHLDRVVAARPNAWEVRLERAEVHGRLGHTDEREVDLSLIRQQGGYPSMALSDAEDLARDGRWTEAAGLLDRHAQFYSLNPEFNRARSIAAVRSDNPNLIASRLAEIKRTLEQGRYLVEALSAAESLILVDGSAELATQFADRLEPVLVRLRSMAHKELGQACTKVGGLHLHARHDDRAIARLKEGYAAGDISSYNLVLRAWHAARRGDRATASALLSEPKVSQPAPNETFWDRQEFEWLRQRVETILADLNFPTDPFRR